MNEEEIKIFESKGRFTLIGDGEEIESSETKIILNKESLSLSSVDGNPLLLSLRDIESFFGGDYKIEIMVSDGGRIVLSELGYQFDSFLKSLTKTIHELTEKDLLMKEGGQKGSFKGKYSYQGVSGDSEVTIYDTAIVIRPKEQAVIRIPFSEISKMTEEDYSLLIDIGLDRLVLSSFGPSFDQLKRLIEEALNQLSLRAQSVIQELLPEINPLVIRKLSGLLRDGQAVGKDKIDELSDEIWPGLEEKLSVLGLKDSYDFLKSLSRDSQHYIGIKRDLMGDLTKEYIWLLVPINSNILVMESASTAVGGSKATYLFRIPEGETVDNLVKKINRSMLAINFRREPIYLTDEDLAKPNWIKYRIAIDKIPELKLLRQLFIGRVSHRSDWQENIKTLIREESQRF